MKNFFQELILKEWDGNIGHFNKFLNLIKKETKSEEKILRLNKLLVNSHKDEIKQIKHRLNDNLKIIRLIEYAMLFNKLYIAIPDDKQDLTANILKMKEIEKECQITFLENSSNNSMIGGKFFAKMVEGTSIEDYNGFEDLKRVAKSKLMELFLNSYQNNEYLPFSINCIFGNIPFNSFFVSLMLGMDLKDYSKSFYNITKNQQKLKKIV